MDGAEEEWRNWGVEKCCCSVRGSNGVEEGSDGMA